MRENLYIGEFPPPFGGVTTKNLLLRERAFSECNVTYLDLQEDKRKPWRIPKSVYQIFRAAKSDSCIWIGLGLQKRVHILLAAIERLGGSRALRRTSVVAMASTLSQYCGNHPEMVRRLRSCRAVYMELESMIEEMKPYLSDNLQLLPNCRDGRLACVPHELHDPIRLLFFSRIHPQKGVFILLDMAEILEQMGVSYQLDFYGPVDECCREEFLQRVNKSPNVSYCGLFDVRQKNLYKLEREYDVFLLPTTWIGESCCGAIVESKMAGIPAIVSDWHYNRELVREGEGIVLEELTGEVYAGTVKAIAENPKWYRSLAAAASQSRHRYDIDTYKDALREATKD